MLSRAQSAECLSDLRSMADAYEIYYATFIAIKSAHRIALSNSPTFSKCALFAVSVGASRCASRRRSSAGRRRWRDQDRIFGRLHHYTGRPVASLRGVYMADEGRRPRDDQRGVERRLRKRGGRTKRRAPLGRARREETEIEKGRGRWRLQGYTRPEQGPRARASERASARGEARLRFPRCLLAARPRRGSLACYSTLCSYAIRATLRLRKAWRNERPGRTR